MPKKVRPIKPSAVVAKKKKDFPNAVFEAFNELIIQEWNGRSAGIRQDDVVALMIKKGLKKKEIFANGWLNVEDVYASAGWDVDFDTPDYDGYPSSFPIIFAFR